jgi:hypothetical protein
MPFSRSATLILHNSVLVWFAQASTEHASRYWDIENRNALWSPAHSEYAAGANIALQTSPQFQKCCLRNSPQNSCAAFGRARKRHEPRPETPRLKAQL